MIVTPNKEHYVNYHTAYLSVILSVLGGLFWALPPVIGWWVLHQTVIVKREVTFKESRIDILKSYMWSKRWALVIIDHNPFLSAVLARPEQIDRRNRLHWAYLFTLLSPIFSRQNPLYKDINLVKSAEYFFDTIMIRLGHQDDSSGREHCEYQINWFEFDRTSSFRKSAKISCCNSAPAQWHLSSMKFFT